MTHVSKTQCRHNYDSDGRLSAFAWPGGYPVIYIAADGGEFCPACANGDDGSLCRISDGPDDHQHDGWLIVGSQIHWEGEPLPCVHCGVEIASAYGPAE